MSGPGATSSAPCRDCRTSWRTPAAGALAAAGAVAAAAVVAAALLGGCTGTQPPTGTTSGPVQANTPPATASATTPAVPGTPGTTATQSTLPPTPSGSRPYFTPTDPSSFAMSGRIQVDQALQDPFSNLLQRGALHERVVTLDVVGTPDYPVTLGARVTVLFGTCRCPERGSGLRLTVEDGSAVRDAGNGDIGIRGTFLPVVTAADAITLKRAG